MRQQRIQRQQPKVTPEIVDNRTNILPESQKFEINPEFANLPIRSVTYLEVGEMPPAKVQLLIQEVNRVQENNKGGIHYVIPIRNGKIGTDIVFENEFLTVVREMCEINELGEIVLKNGATECHIIRNKL